MRIKYIRHLMPGIVQAFNNCYYAFLIVVVIILDVLEGQMWSLSGRLNSAAPPLSSVAPE